MNLRQCIFFIWILGSLTACGDNGPSAEDAPIRKQFRQQLANSCQRMSSYAKRVQPLKATGVAEDSLFQLATTPPSQDEAKAEGPSCLLAQELEDALTYFYADPALIEEYTVSQREDTLVAILNENAPSSFELAAQRILKGPQGELRFIHSRIIKSNWLYDHQIEIAISFDSAGYYQDHWLEINNEVAFIQEGFNARIEGKAHYD
ncbi:MAG: hypothetical protein AAF206_18385 [Bacteroidota bacterium]